ncbi:MAG: sigma-70 family RNA polymerase sigma factor [Gaiellaceae bacterium]
MTTIVAERETETHASFGIESQVSDGELMLRIAKGDADAFDEIYRRFARPILGLARRRLADPGKAEDATQETFVSIWRSAGSFRPERGTGSAWLFALARNSIIDRARQRTEATIEEAPEQASGEPDPSEVAETDWLAWEVHTALERLPEREQQVLSMAYFSGLSQTEIAERLDVPLGTVKTRTRSGLSRMATLLEGVKDRGEA